MKIETFKGDYTSIGEELGKKYLAAGARFDDIPIVPDIYAGQLKAYQEHYPEILEQFRAVAKAGKFNEEHVINKMICGLLLWVIKRDNLQRACTIFGINNKNGTIIGRNYDWIPSSSFGMFRMDNPRANSFVSISDMGSGPSTKDRFYVAEDVINDKGLFVGLTYAYHSRWTFGLLRTHMVQLLAERCSTVDEALKLFSKIPLAEPCNYFIADSKGNMAVVEHTSGRRFKVIYPQNGVLIKTNHYLDPELAREDTVLKHKPDHTTFARYKETEKWLSDAKDNLSISDPIALLGNTGCCVCQDLPQTKTIFSLALDMEKRKYLLYWDLFGERKEKSFRI